MTKEPHNFNVDNEEIESIRRIHESYSIRSPNGDCS